VKRFKHSLSNYKLLTAEMGMLVPINLTEVLPGDSLQQSSSILLRCSPLMAPVMHPVTVRVHHWFVPTRILWDGWESFITGGKDGAGDGVGSPPTLTSATPVVKGSAADYFGIPPGTVNTAVSALPFLAYKKIWEDWYVDQDFYDETTLPPVDLGWGLLPHSWEKDYFTTARPWPQKGPDVSMPLQGQANVIPQGVPTFTNTQGGPPFNMRLTTDGHNMWSGAAGSEYNAMWQDPKLAVDLSAATAVNVNDVRLAFALQRYQEARARYGSRYTEYLRYLGVRSSDARLQRAEFLGGGKQTISFSEVLKTGAGEDPVEPIGTMKGHGIAAMRSNRYRRFFEEHGYVLSLLSVRPKTMYVQGINRMWTRQAKEDYWQRELEQIGQQEIDNKELHHAATPGIWGYQDRYSEYKTIPSTIAGDFRDTLNHWHLARDFATPPTLNGAFLVCDPSKRVFAEQTTNPLWVMSYNNIQARRMVRKSGSARIL